MFTRSSALEVAEPIAIVAHHLGDGVVSTFDDRFAAAVDQSEALLTDTHLGTLLDTTGTIATGALKLDNLLGGTDLDGLANAVDACKSWSADAYLGAIRALFPLASGTGRLDLFICGAGFN